MSELDDKPNIKRIFIALTEGGLVGKYTEDKCGIDLSEALKESFFADWLTTTKEMPESKAQSIWTDLNLANEGIYDPVEEKQIIDEEGYKLINWDIDDDGFNSENEDEKDNSEDNQHKSAKIGDINNRFANIANQINAIEIESGKRNQRIIFIIDTRYKSDKCYGYKPNSNDKKRCDCFESNANNLINESLIQNLRLCLLPKINKEKENITINTQRAFGLTFSFQCFKIFKENKQ